MKLVYLRLARPEMDVWMQRIGVPFGNHMAPKSRNCLLHAAGISCLGHQLDLATAVRDVDT
jgi:hypothetical protein